jgi:Ca2+-binding RTX toxin-like protein
MSGTVTSGRKTFKDTAGANTYNIGADATRVTIAGKMTAGDIINLEGLASEYTASASGRTITLKSATQTVTFQLSNTAGAASVRFLDGDLSAAFATKGGATLGGVKLSRKAVDIDDSKLGTTDSASVDFTGSTGGGSSGGGSTGGTTGQTYNLTTDINNVSGTAGNDIFNASNTTATAANATFTTPDSIDGGAGNDLLNITGSAAGWTAALSNVKNVETVNVFDTTGGTLSLAGSSGVTNIVSNGSTTAPTFSNIGSTAVGLGVSNSAVGATFTFTTAAVAGVDDTATLTLSGQTAGTNVVNGVETLKIISSSAANTVTGITAAQATKIVTSGDQTLSLGTLPATVLTVDSSAATAGVTYTVPNNATAATITGGSGNDSITMTGGTAVNDNINLGAGDDTVTVSANLANTDSIAGGDGNDKLASTSVLLRGLSIADPSKPAITGFETLSFTDDLGANTITTANVQAGINTVELQVAFAGAGTVTLEAGSKKITQTAAQAAAMTVNDTGTATTDTLTLDIASTVGAVNVLANNYTVNGFETLNIVTTTAGTATKTTQTLGTITATPDAGGAQIIKLSGDNSVTAGVITISGATTGTVDASGLTGTRTFSNVGATPVGVTNIIGSANADVIVGSATATTIDGGAGNDNITGGAGNDSVSGSAGDDTITGGGGNDVLLGGAGNDSITQGAAGTTTSIDGGDGNDTITLTGMIASTQSIAGGAGTDTLVLGTADVATINAFSFAANNTFNKNITGIEKVQFANALTSNPDMSRVASINWVVSTADNGGNDSIGGLADGSTLEFTAGQTTGGAASLADSTGTNDRVTMLLNSAGGLTMNTFTIAGVENATITSNDTDTTTTGATANAADTLTFTAAAAKSITVTGNSASLGLTLTGSTAVTNVNASAYKGALTTTLVSTVAATLVGGEGADVLTGSAMSDSINGGAGDDTIAGGLGADVLDGGAGVNTLNAANMVSQTDGGTVTSTGAIINLGSSAVTASSVSSAQLGTGKSYISGSLTSFAAGKAGYLFGSNSASADSALDSISNFTKITGTSGPDYIVGNVSGAQTITGGNGADYMVGGSGADTYVAGQAGTSVVGTATMSANIANNDTLVFSNGVDVISNFTSGIDKLDVATAGTAPTTLIGLAKTLDLVTGTTYSILGTYDSTTQTFTVNSAATSSTTNVATLIVEGDAGALTPQTTTGYVVLVGVSSLVAADFV